MPVKDFSESKRQLFWDMVFELCSEITIANGYNTQPFVSNDAREAKTSQEDFSLLVVEGGENTLGVGVGGCSDQVITIEVLGYALSEDYNPTLQLNKLIQDVRNALNENLGRTKDMVGCSAVLIFGDLETDTGILTMDGVAAFSLPVNYTYKDGPSW